MLLGHEATQENRRESTGTSQAKILLCLLSKHRSYLSLEGEVNSRDLCPEKQRFPKIQMLIPQCRQQKLHLTSPVKTSKLVTAHNSVDPVSRSYQFPKSPALGPNHW